MVLSNMSPSWFYGIDVFLEFSFALICLAVALFSYIIYKKTDQRLVKYFGISFGFISVSYFIQSILNFLLISRLNENVCRIAKIQSVNIFNSLGILIHIFFMTIGLSILLYTTLKDKRQKTLWLIIILALTAIFLNQNNLYMFYVISTIFLAFISLHYVLNYLRVKQTRTLLVALAFAFLLFGSFHFLISVNHQLFYAIGHFLEFFAYIFILINLYLVQKR